MVDFQYMERYDIQDLRRIMALLRAPGGCPWDREQTHESIRRNMLEEAYEVVEAIDEKDPEHLGRPAPGGVPRPDGPGGGALHL